MLRCVCANMQGMNFSRKHMAEITIPDKESREDSRERVAKVQRVMRACLVLN